MKKQIFSGRFSAYRPTKAGLAPVAKVFRVKAVSREHAMDLVANAIPRYKGLVFKAFIFGSGKFHMNETLAMTLRGAGPQEG